MTTGSEATTDTNISTEINRDTATLNDPTLQILRAWLNGLPGLDDVTVRENENGWAISVGLNLRNSYVFESLSEIEDVISTPARTLYGRTEGRKCLIEDTVVGDEAGYVPSYELWVEGLDPSEVFFTALREGLLRELQASTPREGASDHVADNLGRTVPCEEISNEKEGDR